MMSKITKVSAQKRSGRYNIFLDNKYAFSASERTLTEFRLFKDSVLTEKEIEKIKQFDTDAKASELAARYLSYQIRTIDEVRQYLVKHELSPEAIDSAIEEFINLGYLNDLEYARLFIKNDLAVGQDGPASVAQKLRLKKVSDNNIEDALAEVEPEDWVEVGSRLIKSLKNQLGKIAFNEVKKKMTLKLLQHGFRTDLVQAIIDDLDLVNEETQEDEALRKQGIKAYKRFKRLDESQRKYKIRTYLYSHGFSNSDIDRFLAGEVISLSELDEY